MHQISSLGCEILLIKLRAFSGLHQNTTTYQSPTENEWLCNSTPPCAFLACTGTTPPYVTLPCAVTSLPKTWEGQTVKLGILHTCGLVRGNPRSRRICARFHSSYLHHYRSHSIFSSCAQKQLAPRIVRLIGTFWKRVAESFKRH